MVRKIVCAGQGKDEFFKETLRWSRCLRVGDAAPAMHNTEFPEGGSLTNSRMGEIPLETRASSPRGTRRLVEPGSPSRRGAMPAGQRPDFTAPLRFGNVPG